MPFLFLSPSTQAGNPYVTEGNERLWMNRIADRMEPYLRASGINVTRNDPEGTVGTSIRASNAGNYDFHLALHSNAAPPQSAGTVRGIDLYYYPGSTDGLRMANILADNLREIYIEAYTQKEASDYIFRETAKELYQIFGSYQPELTAQDFFFMELGSAGIMRAYMAHPCDEELTLEKKLQMFLTMSLRSYHVPEDEIQKIIAFIGGMDIRTVSERVMHELFKALAMRFEFTL